MSGIDKIIERVRRQADRPIDGTILELGGKFSILEGDALDIITAYEQSQKELGAANKRIEVETRNSNKNAKDNKALRIELAKVQADHRVVIENWTKRVTSVANNWKTLLGKANKRIAELEKEVSAGENALKYYINQFEER